MDSIPTGRVSAPTVWSEIQPLWRGVKGPPLVAVFAGYFDDSHRFNNPDRGGILAIAGYVAAVPVWDALFHHQWWSAIAAAPHPLTEFKASDCRNNKGEFENWTKEERDQITKDLVGVITSPHYDDLIFGLGSAIEVPYTDDMGNRKTFQALAYNLCLGRVVIGALQWARPRHSSIDALHFIFDMQPGLMGYATGLFMEAREVYEEGFRARIRPPQFGESVHLAPLQAADLLAYETYKELYNRSLPIPWPVSKALERLVSKRLHYADYFEARELERWLRSPDNWISEIVNEDGKLNLPVLYDNTGVRRIQREYWG